ncbi:NAD(P) transhydrogenase subunit beta [Planctomycetes bacterium Poly30]|uniref:NAD(P) transhydrogenase subunit beta n=1 Tax=Saltatorellus ferox TaxID=2528018 RepID=A0A518F0G7_9BACT|nr:NAD(P) transhydrogenase subunit beta [Planctomycetes bacterium Poly30]
MEYALVSVAYLTSAVLFILSLRGLSSQDSARRGNAYGMIGMGIAIFATLTRSGMDSYWMILVALVIGSVIGQRMAGSVAMTAMPELVALLHSFVGVAAVLVGFATYLASSHGGTIFEIEIFVDVFIGAITAAGSVVAYLKLKGSLSGKPLLLPSRHMLNLGLVGVCVLLAIPFVAATEPVPVSVIALVGVTVLALGLGAHLVAAIGGADMPVVVSMLNSYSGWTASAAGFMLGNDLLIVVGALVGSSGLILSIIMCRAMNRSIVSVIFGGFGGEPVAKPGGAEAAQPEGDIQETDVTEVVERLLSARNVIIVPGYGMAVARAQHKVQEMAQILKDAGVRLRFAIHPVAGRLPGHMNVLLAEANVPYDIVLEMDEINADFGDTDVVLVIGANDIVNPSAETDASSPIYGMPVLQAWLSKFVVVMKRGRSTGYAGVDNPLFYHESAHMLFGDASASMDGIVAELRAKSAVAVG